MNIEIDVPEPQRPRFEESWGKFRGLARLRRGSARVLLIPSAWLVLAHRHGPRLVDVLRRLFL